jgi:catechol 2,3-dioxygenase-like lactoylglutathione lyase family enzyme
MEENVVAFTYAVPVLAALDVAETAGFYERVMGFTADYVAEDYGIVSRGSVTIHFWHCQDRSIAESTGCRVAVEGVDALYAAYSAEEIIHPNAPLQDQPWGTREFAVVDLNGNLLTFFERIDT